MNERSVRTALGASLFCLAATLASAQGLGVSPQRPTGGLFGSGRSGNQTFDISALLVGAFEDNVVPGTDSGAEILDGISQPGGSYNGLSTSAAYARRFRRVSIGASGGSALRRYPVASESGGMQHGVAAGIGLQLGTAQLGLSQRLRYSPYYSITTTPQLFAPELAAVPAISDTAVLSRDSRSYGSSATLTQAIGRRLTLEFAASMDRTEFLQDSTGLRTQSAQGRGTYGLSRDIGLVLGYRYQQAKYQLSTASARVTTLNGIDIGIDYHRALSLSRKTTIAFTTGTVAVRDLSGDTQYRLVGTARLNRAIARSWHATAAYNRGVEFIEGFHEPFFADTAAVDFGGSFNRRVELSLNGVYSFGEIGLSQGGGGTVSYNGSARVRAALSRVMAVFSEYHIYRYRFDQGGVLPTGLLPRLDRQGVRVGLELWLPLIR
jgi:hypothetical protein